MTKQRILCAVLDQSFIAKEVALEATYAVTYVTTLAEACAVLAHDSFDLLVCGVHFDNCQMPLLLHHCKSDPRHAAMPFVCVRAFRGRLPESTYGQIRKAASLLGAVYVDLTHWIDADGRESALRDFKGLIATLLRQSSLYDSDEN
jgi:hypothetical protein